MSEGKVYKTLECARRAQKKYMSRLKSSESDDDRARWLKMCKNQSAGGLESQSRMYANPDENKERLERVRAQKREYARKKREDANYREKCNSWQREYRLKKKQIE